MITPKENIEKLWHFLDKIKTQQAILSENKDKAMDAIKAGGTVEDADKIMAFENSFPIAGEQRDAVAQLIGSLSANLAILEYNPTIKDYNHLVDRAQTILIDKDTLTNIDISIKRTCILIGKLGDRLDGIDGVETSDEDYDRGIYMQRAGIELVAHLESLKKFLPSITPVTSDPTGYLAEKAPEPKFVEPKSLTLAPTKPQATPNWLSRQIKKFKR